MAIPRLDRYATLYFFHPLLSKLRWNCSKIPILMYHSISDVKDCTHNRYYQTTTTPSVFDAQMRLLFEKGYSVITLNEASELLLAGTMPERPSVVLTFDDGYMDFFTAACPVLDKYGFKATVFISTHFVERHPMAFNGRICLDWPAVRALHERGYSFGSHTVTHQELKYMKRPAVMHELKASKEAIEDRLGSPVTSFSYPYAFPEESSGFKAFLKDALAVCGYKNGVSTIVGRAGIDDDIHFLKRIPINLFDDGRFFTAKLEGGYDWMHDVQYTSKIIRSKVN